MELPTQVGRYEIVGLIGRGGMGVVYKARDNVLGRLVALKVMTSNLADDAEVHTRFLREARSVSMLQHANIVVIYELGEYDGSPYHAMEFLDGEPLDRVIRSRAPLSVLDKTDVILQVAKALQYAHDKGVIHRDVKPGNIMRMRDGNVKVVDFGIAHLTDQTITKTGLVLGTLSYLAPEQLNGEGIDRRTDIFSLGVMMYQLLTGNLPFVGASTAETMMKILLEPPPPLSQAGDVNLPELQPIVAKVLAKKKEERFQNCSELADALAQLRKRLEARTQAIAPEQRGQASVSQTPMRKQTRPSAEAGGYRLKWALAGLAMVVATASFYLWLTRSRNYFSSSLPVTTGVSSSLATSVADNVQLTLSPSTAQVVSGRSLEFSAMVSGTNAKELTWSVKEGDAGGSVVTRGARASGREVSVRAFYIAPNKPGIYHVVISTKAEPHKSAIAEVTVTARSLSPSTTPVKRKPQSDSPFAVR